MTFNPVQYPSSLNVYIPQLQGSLWSNFSRDPNSFLINKIVTHNPVKQQSGLYLAFDPGAASRIALNDQGNINNNQYRWQPNTDPSKNFSKKQSFQPYVTERIGIEFTCDQETEESADWSVVDDHAYDGSNLLMTVRSLDGYTALGNTANYVDFNNNVINTATATAAGGGQFDASTVAQSYFQKALSFAIRTIERGTNAVGSANVERVVMSPTVAMIIGESPEIKAYLTGSIYSLPYLQQALATGDQMATSMLSSAFKYNMPGAAYGLELVIDPTIVNVGVEGGANDFEYIIDSVAPNSVMLVSKPNTLQSNLNKMSGLSMPIYQDMEVIVEYSAKYKRYEGVISDNRSFIVRPQLCFLLTDCLSNFSPAG